MPHSPPAPLSATYDAPTSTLEITFDRTLSPGPVAPNNLGCRFANMLRTNLVPGTAAGNKVTAIMGGAFLDLGPNVCAYHATPPDIVSTYSVPAAPFADFPVT